MKSKAQKKLEKTIKTLQGRIGDDEALELWSTAEKRAFYSLEEDYNEFIKFNKIIKDSSNSSLKNLKSISYDNSTPITVIPISKG